MTTTLRGKVRSQHCPACKGTMRMAWDTDLRRKTTMRRRVCECGHSEPVQAMDRKVYSTLAPEDARTLWDLITAGSLAVKASQDGDASSLRYHLTDFQCLVDRMSPRLQAKIGDGSR